MDFDDKDNEGLTNLDHYVGAFIDRHVGGGDDIAIEYTDLDK